MTSIAERKGIMALIPMRYPGIWNRSIVMERSGRSPPSPRAAAAVHPIAAMIPRFRMVGVIGFIRDWVCCGKGIFGLLPFRGVKGGLPPLKKGGSGETPE